MVITDEEGAHYTAFLRKIQYQSYPSLDNQEQTRRQEYIPLPVRYAAADIQCGIDHDYSDPPLPDQRVFIYDMPNPLRFLQCSKKAAGNRCYLHFLIGFKPCIITVLL